MNIPHDFHYWDSFQDAHARYGCTREEYDHWCYWLMRREKDIEEYADDQIIEPYDPTE